MVNAREEQPLTRLEVLVLARLSASASGAPGPKDLAETVNKLALPNESPSRAKEVALETLDALRGRGLVNKSVRPRKGSLGDRSLTEQGRRTLCVVFGLTSTPAWREVRSTHLPALALGVKPRTGRGKKAKKAALEKDAMVVAVLQTKLGVQHAPNVSDVCDALIVERLGMPPGKLSLGKIRAHVLAQRVGVEAKGELKEVAARAVVKELQVRGGKKDAFAEAIVRRWMREGAAASQSAPPSEPPAPQPTNGHSRAPAPSSVQTPPSVQDPPTKPVPAVAEASPAGTTSRSSPSPADTSAALLQLVRDAIPRVGAQGRFGDEKVFVSALWHDIERDRRIDGLTLERFKSWLVRANRDGWLVLVRADLVGAMNPKLVADSEIEDRGATFHFVLDPRSGAAASERRTHVR